MSSVEATKQHIARVRELLACVQGNLLYRGKIHDNSKLGSPEVEIFDEFTPQLASSTYGSEEYKSFLAAMKPALDHHYACNPHHPEYHDDGIKGMSLLDVIEMFVDWKAATERHDNGCIFRSIEINQKRFGFSDELKAILVNTARELGFSRRAE